MKVRIEIDEETLRNLVANYLMNQLGGAAPEDITGVRIEVKSKQNWRAEWETAAFRAVYER